MHTNTETNLVWNILDKARAYKPERKRCLFNREIYHFLKVKFTPLKK